MKQANLKSPALLHILSIKGKQKKHEHFTLSVPFAPGELLSHEDVKFFDNNGSEVLACATPLSYWHDKSVRWLKVKGYLPFVCAGNEKHQAPTEIHVKKSEYQKVQTKQECLLNRGDALQVNFNDSALSLDKTKFLHLDVAPIKTKLAFKIAGKSSFTITKIDHVFETEYTSNNKPYACIIKQYAELSVNDGHVVAVLRAKIDVNFASDTIDIQVEVHNCLAQIPEHGKWDLGNENSLYLESMGFDVYTPKDSERSIYIENDSSINESGASLKSQSFKKVTYTNTDVSLIQHSSGGKHWNSPNHKTSDNTVKLTQKGASLIGDSKLEVIERANPTLLSSSGKQTVSITPQHFWQKFPASIVLTASSSSINYIDNQSTDTIEIQPGETKSHTISIAFNANDDQTPDSTCKSTSENIDAEFCVFVPNSRIDASNTLPWFSSSATNEKLHSIVELGLNSTSNFFLKREALDEFGWRHFGDIYADHEADNYDGELPFVSHYNNQYDPLYGFLKQWLIDGNAKWRELADDLFDHLINIDIYRTEHDKPEYNNGLFWHTDHYVQAETATHRTYSRHQASNVYMDHAGGGGPGAHHCYSSGISLYYFITGDERAANAVIGMANWMKHIYEGDGTLLGKFLQLKNANHLKMPFSDKLLLGTGTGIVRNPITNRYPLDRGTGNYVNVLLDAFELTQESSYLDDIEGIILNTINKDDKFEDRGFEDIENTWFYTVFLQASAKYLHFLSTFKIQRKASQAIVGALLHYIDYIAEQEQPALKNAAVLEYPNDTWTGQDIRKVQLLCIGSLLADEQKKILYTNKAHELNDWIYQKLATSKERFYTRILALTMQNYGGLELLKDCAPRLELNSANVLLSEHKNPSRIKRICRFARAYSLTKERSLLLTRIPKLQKFLGKP